MLFRKDIEPRCEYCRYGTALGEGEIGCLKFGVTLVGESCPKFRYSPVKREPEKRLRVNASQYSAEDFEL